MTVSVLFFPVLSCLVLKLNFVSSVLSTLNRSQLLLLLVSGS